jgi:uncharacterized membrane protein
MAENPYAAPKTHVADVDPALPDGDFIPDGRAVPTGNGWKWIADGWAFTGGQRLTFIGLALLVIVLWFVANFIPFIGPLAVSLFFPVISAGFMLGCDAVRRGEPLEVGHLFAGFKHRTGQLIALGAVSIGAGIVFALIAFLILGASFFPLMMGEVQPAPEDVGPLLTTVLLTMLVVMAISIPFAMAMWFAVPLITFNQLGIAEALKTSFFACLKNLLPFLVWGVAVFFLAIVASIPLFLGWLLLLPTLWASMYLIYRDVFYEA